MPKKSDRSIRLRGVRQNNLKGFDLDIPLGKLTVVTGLSGAGKSSLVFDTLHAEGQRRYVETFSAYTRQFLEMLDRPAVESVENIRPSIAIEQTNTVKTSRSTVGTMTELCDFFKVWFSHRATLFDPATGKPIRDDHPSSVWKYIVSQPTKDWILTFPLRIPENMKGTEIVQSLRGQGYTRIHAAGGFHRLDALDSGILHGEIEVVQDRVPNTASARGRFIEAAETAFRFGNGWIRLHPADQPGAVETFCQGLRSPATGRSFRSPSPALFSYNSPIGACPTCRGFGRVIEIDPDLVIPDPSLSIRRGAIKPFTGKVYQECLRDLNRHARRLGIRTDLPWKELSADEQALVFEGEPDYPPDEEGWMTHWYGVNRFFRYLEGKAYKMHVRVFLSKYRAYHTCPDCQGQRLSEESLCWRWKGRTLADLYRLPLDELLERIREHPETGSGHPQAITAWESIHARLSFLVETGLGYLNLNRSSRSLSGGETERVNLTSCLGSAVVETLFVLDEPTVGLHNKDIHRVVAILRRLADQGNTVVVVEHDETVMQAADHLIEIGPEPGSAGGKVVFAGSLARIRQAHRRSLTGAYLSGRRTIAPPNHRRPVPTDKNGRPSPDHPDAPPLLSIYGARKHNLRGIDLHLPLDRMVCLSGVSGSGKSTLLNQVIYQNLQRRRGQPTEDAAEVLDLEPGREFSHCALIDQGPIGKTPRSTPAVYSGAWEILRHRFAATESARSAGFTASHFSFNSGDGRCPHCQGLGYEQVEMQFLSDVYVPCPICEGKRFRPEVLEVTWRGFQVDTLLDSETGAVLKALGDDEALAAKLRPLVDCGLGYLKLGQALTTLSGGESQRLKLVRYLGTMGKRSRERALILLDEPTTGLHKHDLRHLLKVLQNLVDAGHSVLVIEHHTDILKSADWIVEMGPGAGNAGGEVVAQGAPEHLARMPCPSAPFLKQGLNGNHEDLPPLIAAEEPAVYQLPIQGEIQIQGAREHNLRNLNLSIPHQKTTVVTGVSGSGKSTLAFDIVFAEGQRRFMEAMSPYARQFVEQLPKPAVDRLTGLAPSVAIEQRVTRGTRKSTVATVTEVAQHLRLLYARIGIQTNPATGNRVESVPPEKLIRRALERLKRPGRGSRYLCAPMVRGRKGHYAPMADWARAHGYPYLRCDGKLNPTHAFEKLDRYAEHDVDVVLADTRGLSRKEQQTLLEEALKVGKGRFYLWENQGEVHFSTTRTDPETGESFPEPDPKLFSWNSPRGWCPTCRGNGVLFPDDDTSRPPELCPDCGGDRLNRLARHVYLEGKGGVQKNLPDLLRMDSGGLIAFLQGLRLDRRGKSVTDAILPEVVSRLHFMDQVGLDYLSLDRSTDTLSGGEAQRIRLAGQLGSNLSGVLYVLDEPTIGLHSRDNELLLRALRDLRKRRNTVLIVEHDESIMRAADHIIDLGPGAGKNGGQLTASGRISAIRRNPDSLTGRYLKNPPKHPVSGRRRPLPEPPRQQGRTPDWLLLEGASLRNLRGGDFHFPIGRLIGVCGVSGAGKSTLVHDILRPGVERAIREGRSTLRPKKSEQTQLPFTRLYQGNAFRKVIEVDQSPIGKTPRSTPATYIGVLDLIRQHFASLPEARMRGFTPGTFSFNTPGGRCETCKGAGRIKMEMNFLPDTYVDCEDCGGRRYGPEVEGIRWKDQSIADVLAMSFEEAAGFFDFDQRLGQMLGLMVENGLGYLNLGQPSPTLSGGEAQRMKLVAEIIRGLESPVGEGRNGGRGILYLLEEPTIGLHLSDCERLAALLHRLVDQGNTVVVIEHQLDILAEADYLIELGPGGGQSGGKRTFSGPPEKIHRSKTSATAPYLTPILS